MSSRSPGRRVQGAPPVLDTDLPRSGQSSTLSSPPPARATSTRCSTRSTHRHSAAHHSLAARDLLRGETTGLPSGEAVARLVGATPLTADELEHSWPHGTPLWFYILKEAEHRGGGDRLGPVGGRIVAEVLIGLLRADPASYLSLEPGWKPTLCGRTAPRPVWGLRAARDAG